MFGLMLRAFILRLVVDVTQRQENFLSMAFLEGCVDAAPLRDDPKLIEMIPLKNDFLAAEIKSNVMAQPSIKDEPFSSFKLHDPLESLKLPHT